MAMEPSLNLPMQGIEVLLGLSELAHQRFALIDLRCNKLSSLENFGTHEALRELHLEENAITSLQGLTKQPLLQRIFLTGNPIARHPHYHIMVLLTVGFSLTCIDHVQVLPEQREAARELGPHAALAVSHGWMLDLQRRTSEEYSEIISRLRKARRSSFRGASLSFPLALGEVLRRSGAVAIPPASLATGTSGQKTSNDSSVELLHGAVVQLSKRVQQLESELREAKMEAQLQRGHMVAGPRAPLMYSASELQLSSWELQLVDAVEYNRGVSVRSNASLGGHGATVVSGCQYLQHAVVVFGTQSIGVFRHFDRIRVAECEHVQMTEVMIDPASNRLTFHMNCGEWYTVEFAEEMALCSATKVVGLRRGKRPVLTSKFTEETQKRFDGSEVGQSLLEPARKRPTAPSECFHGEESIKAPSAPAMPRLPRNAASECVDFPHPPSSRCSDDPVVSETEENLVGDVSLGTANDASQRNGSSARNLCLVTQHRTEKSHGSHRRRVAGTAESQEISSSRTENVSLFPAEDHVVETPKVAPVNAVNHRSPSLLFQLCSSDSEPAHLPQENNSRFEDSLEALQITSSDSD